MGRSQGRTELPSRLLSRAENSISGRRGVVERGGRLGRRKRPGDSGKVVYEIANRTGDDSKANDWQREGVDRMVVGRGGGPWAREVKL